MHCRAKLSFTRLPNQLAGSTLRAGRGPFGHCLLCGKSPPGKKSGCGGNGEDQQKNRGFVFYRVARLGHSKPQIDGGGGKP